MAVPVQIVIDCADPGRLAVFWADALGYVVQPPPEGFDSWEAFLTDRGVPESEWNRASAVVDPDGGGPRIFLQRVPEPKTTKNRLHLDLNVGGPAGTVPDERHRRVAEEIGRLTNLGASLVEWRREMGEEWAVMTDPEANEFCLQ